MLYRWKENSVRTNCLAAFAHLTITVSEIERYIGRKSSFFNTPLHLNMATPFGMEKLEWLGYPKVNKFRRYVYSFWHDTRSCQTHTRTHTPHAGNSRAYAWHRTAKIAVGSYRNLMWFLRRRPMLRIARTDKVSNEEVHQRANTSRNLLNVTVN